MEAKPGSESLRGRSKKRNAARAEYDRLAALAWSPRPLKSPRSNLGSVPAAVRFILDGLACADPSPRATRERGCQLKRRLRSRPAHVTRNIGIYPVQDLRMEPFDGCYAGVPAFRSPPTNLRVAVPVC